MLSPYGFGSMDIVGVAVLSFLFSLANITVLNTAIVLINMMA
jgi:hypothetical protein